MQKPHLATPYLNAATGLHVMCRAHWSQLGYNATLSLKQSGQMKNYPQRLSQRPGSVTGVGGGVWSAMCKRSDWITRVPSDFRVDESDFPHAGAAACRGSNTGHTQCLLLVPRAW